jgi:polysaccharide biosynthesis transport protein
LELKHYLAMIRRWGWLLAVGTVLAAGVSFIATLGMTPGYRATTTLMVGPEIDRPNPQAQDFTNSERLAQSYAQIVRRQPLLIATLEALRMDVSWEALAAAVNAVALPQTQLIQISVVSSSPSAARVIADELAHQLILRSPTSDERERAERREFVESQLGTLQVQISDAEKEIKVLEGRLGVENSARGVQDLQMQISGIRQKSATLQTTYTNLLAASRTGSANQIRIVEPAVVGPRPVTPNMPLNVAVAAGIGFLLALTTMLALEYFDDRIKDADDVARVLNLPVLGRVPRVADVERPSDQLMVLPGSEAGDSGEAYRLLRTGLIKPKAGGPTRTLLIFSATPGEGKTTTAANLAITVALGGKRVVLCDADLRRPRIHALFGVPNYLGLSSLLQDDELRVAGALVDGPVAGLKILPSGPTPARPADLLGSEAMQRRMRQIEQVADVVILDTPAALAVADASVLASLGGEGILVVDARGTRSALVRTAANQLEDSGIEFTGVVLNKFSPRHARPYSYYYASEDSRAEGQRGTRGDGGISAVESPLTGALNPRTTNSTRPVAQWIAQFRQVLKRARPLAGGTRGPTAKSQPTVRRPGRATAHARLPGERGPRPVVERNRQTAVVSRVVPPVGS